MRLSVCGDPCTDHVVTSDSYRLVRPMALFPFVYLTRHAQSLESESGNPTRPTPLSFSSVCPTRRPILLRGILWTDVTGSEATGKPLLQSQSQQTRLSFNGAVRDALGGYCVAAVNLNETRHFPPIVPVGN